LQANLKLILIFLVIASLIITPLSINPTFAQQKNVYNIYPEEYPIFFEYTSDPLLEAIAGWESWRDDLEFRVVSTYAESDIRIYWIKEKGEGWVGLASLASLFVELGDSNCGNGWNQFHQSTVRNIIAHEIGHAIGYDHELQEDSIMHAQVRGIHYSTTTYHETLLPNSHTFFETCVKGKSSSLAYSIESTDSSKKFDLYVVPSINEVLQIQNKILNLQLSSVPTYNEGTCDKQNISKMDGICNVGSGSMIFIHWKGDSRLSVNLRTAEVNIPQQNLKVYSPIPQPSVQPSIQISPDSDGDGILDNVDNCRYEAETYNDYNDRDGCPDTKPLADSDEDGILDKHDLCDYQPETFNGYLDTDGCPDDLSEFTASAEEMRLEGDEYRSKISDLEEKLGKYEVELSSKNFMTEKAKQKLDEAWDTRWLILIKINNADNKFRGGLSSYYQGNFEDANGKFQSLEPKLKEINNDFDLLRKQIDESVNLENEKTCFLFWCW